MSWTVVDCTCVRVTMGGITVQDLYGTCNRYKYMIVPVLDSLILDLLRFLGKSSTAPELQSSTLTPHLLYHYLVS